MNFELSSFCLVVMMCILTGVTASSFEASAICISQNNKCSPKQSKTSKGCQAYTYIRDQPIGCVRAACKFCNWKSSKNHPVCKSWGIKTWCPYAGKTNNLNSINLSGQTGKSNVNNNVNKKPDNRNKKGMEQTKTGSKCTYKGENGKIVISMSSVHPVDQWTRTKNGGVVWKKNGGSGIDARGSGEMCFRFKVPSSGTYYVTAITSAPHGTEHNDMWLKVSSGVRLIRAKNGVPKRTTTTEYLKAYQNLGGNKMANIISSVNHNPHQLVTNYMGMKDVETICMSGRSSKFTVYSLVLVKCIGRECIRASPYIKNEMNDLKPSRCE